MKQLARLGRWATIGAAEARREESKKLGVMNEWIRFLLGLMILSKHLEKKGDFGVETDR